MSEYRTIPGWSCYTISKEGVVRASARITGSGRFLPARTLRERTTRAGNIRVDLAQDGKRRSALVKGLVEETFGA